MEHDDGGAVQESTLLHLVRGTALLLIATCCQGRTVYGQTAAPTPGDDNVVYRLVHRLIADRDAPAVPPPCDITSPGPDTSCFTNSAFTLPKGRSYIENAPFTIDAAGRGAPQVWSWQFLNRTAVTDDCEFRIFSEGPTVVRPPTTAAAFDGFQPLGFELKAHLWGESDWLLYPVIGLRASLLTNLASRPFQLGNQPGVSVLADHFLPGGLKLEWNAGYFGSGLSGQPAGTSLPYLGVQWSLQKPLSDRLTVFYHGYYNGANLPLLPARIVSGFGGQWNVTQRLAVYGTCNWNLEPSGSPVGGWTGFAYAY